MDQCGGCRHVKALHRPLGGCRVNGCPCVGFSQAAAFPMELAAPVAPALRQPSRALSVATRVATTAIAFIAGVLIGHQL